MCGIIGYTGNTEALPFIIKGLKALEYRGYDSAGVAVIDGNKIETVKSVGRISALEEKLSARPLCGSCGIGHTRWATHGAPSTLNCHPHSSYGGRFSIVHNGIIENYNGLRTLCLSRNIPVKSDTDSELIAHILEWEYSGDVMTAIERTVSQLNGSFALCILCADYPDTLFAAAQKSPLLIGLSGDGVCVASDGAAMPKSITSLLSLSDRQYARITRNEVSVFKDGKAVEPSVLNFTYSPDDCELCGFPHYMLKEMYEQPEAIARTTAIDFSDKRFDLENKPLMLIGCGSSYNAAIASLPLLRYAVNARTHAMLASEYLFAEPFCSTDTTAVFLSQSGETADTVAAAELARSRGLRTFAITNVPHSTLTRVCDDAFITRAGREISVATTKGFTTQIAALAALSAVRSTEIRTNLDNLPFAAERSLDLQIADCAKLFINAPCAFFIGRSADLGIAYEGALKLREITYIPAFGIAAGELKHGSISLITPSVPVVAVCTNAALIGKTLFSVSSVRSRGGKVIAVTPFEEIAGASDYAVTLPQVHPLLSPAVSVIPLQKLAYAVANLLSRDVDKPRHLAKSVTVE